MRLCEWYEKHPRLQIEAWGGTALRWAGLHNPDGRGSTAWNVFAASSNYISPGAALRSEGCQVDESEYGKFGWAVDPDGNQIEL